jgi:site-specific recombinase
MKTQPDMTAAEFAAELEAHGFRIVGNRIVDAELSGISWKPVMIRGHIDRAMTLTKILRERREEIARQMRISVA